MHKTYAHCTCLAVETAEENNSSQQLSMWIFHKSVISSLNLAAKWNDCYAVPSNIPSFCVKHLSWLHFDALVVSFKVETNRRNGWNWFCYSNGILLIFPSISAEHRATFDGNGPLSNVFAFFFVRQMQMSHAGNRRQTRASICHDKSVQTQVTRVTLFTWPLSSVIARVYQRKLRRNNLNLHAILRL